MNFRGLFIGIDRYASAKVGELGCANRDAIALHALFLDTLGGDARLLTDQSVISHTIEKEFEALCESQEEDVVVVSFSGHGTEDHQLVAHDTDPSRLKETSLHLDTIRDWFSRIPAKRLILVLDCCFAGGIGAKVLQVDAKARDMRSTESLLEQLSGEGRIILTASGPNEPAWEKTKVGHGLLTHFLIEALIGAEEVRQAGKISVYRLLEYVTRRTGDAASQFGETQRPTLLGRLDGELTWPIFTRGKHYYAAFPERSMATATRELDSLQLLDFPAPIIQAWGRVIPSLNELQVEAINDYGILSGEHVVVSAPTSSGKTMIGELAAIKGVLERKKTLFLLPLKALVYDKQRHFSDVYGPFGVRTIDATGETDNISPLLQGKYDIALLTYEKFASLVLASPYILNQVSTIVVDEVQMIADRSRGANLEFILTLLRMRRRSGIDPQIIALSAVIGDTNGLERWLDARLLRRDERPVPLDEGLVRGDRSFRFVSSDDGQEMVEEKHVPPFHRKGGNQDYVIPLVKKLTDEGKQVIVFRETKSETRAVAKYLAETVGLPPAQDALDSVPYADPSRASTDLHETLRSGIAFHNADLDREERLVIEREYRKKHSSLRVIVATTTLAMGVNTPASAVIIVGLMHPGDEPYSVAEYKNLAGRAGRRGYSERGTSYLVAIEPREEYEYWNHFVCGKPEDLVSRFLDTETDPRTMVLRVLVSARKLSPDGVTADDILNFLEGSFGAFQQTQLSSNWKWDRQSFQRAVDELQGHHLIEQDTIGRLHVTELGALAGEGGAEVISIIRLVECFQNLQTNEITEPTLIVATQMTSELDQIYFPFNKRSTQKEPAAWQGELARQGVSRGVLSSIRRSVCDQFQATARAKKAVACLFHVSDQPMTSIETALTRFGGAFGGVAGPVRSVSSRTCDLLPTAARIAEILNPGLDLSTRVSRLLIRLELGLPSEAGELAQGAGRALARGDYLTLMSAGLIEISAIESCSDESLLRHLNNDHIKVQAVRDSTEAYEEARGETVDAHLLEPFKS